MVVIILLVFATLSRLADSSPASTKQGLNLRPTVAVMTQDPDDPASSYTSYLDYDYIEFVESGGARVVPVQLNQSESYYKTIFEGTNGLLLVGGNAMQFETGKSLLIPNNTTSSFAKKKPVDFDGELKIGDVRYDNIT